LRSATPTGTAADAIGRRISVETLDGPLRYLSAVWSFEPRDECHTQLHFSVNYEFSNPVLAAVASRVFGAMFGEILNAFERRAAYLFPNRISAGAKRQDACAFRSSAPAHHQLIILLQV
jgi:coenzyme Q-binding protein COQ10